MAAIATVSWPFSEIHPDYYQIPVADREALMEEERAYAEAQARDDEDDKAQAHQPVALTVASKPKRQKSAATMLSSAREVESDEINGMETIDLDAADTRNTEEGSLSYGAVERNAVETPRRRRCRGKDRTARRCGSGC